MEYKTRLSDASTFTIVETAGKLSKALVDGHHTTAESLADKVTFHLEVWATNDALNTRFVVSNSQYKKASNLVHYFMTPLTWANVFSSRECHLSIRSTR